MEKDLVGGGQLVRCWTWISFGGSRSNSFSLQLSLLQLSTVLSYTDDRLVSRVSLQEKVLSFGSRYLVILFERILNTFT